MIYVERMRDGKVLNSYDCETIPEAKLFATCMAGLLADNETVRIVQEVQM